MRSIKLFCLPYAGGSAMMYLQLKFFFKGKSIQVCPVEIAGRGSRITEPLYSNIHEAVEDLYESIKKQINEGESFALLGYSMGALLAYEIAKRIKEDKIKGLEHIFMVSKESPDVYEDEYEQNLYELPDDIFIKAIGELGGTPREILECEEAMNFFVPILRADYKIVETYEPEPKAIDLGCNITAIAGREDKFTVKYLERWKRFTSKDFKMFIMDGGHFFINEHMSELADIINNTLKENR